ncbi:CheW-like domain [Anaerobiospirillum thomasii]|uniref:CheW-like domain n=1 Tax=Anaerobiospirillum thomasii TaxID=179995 RepID=A0A2X0VET1_9GAMM|nr:chemotaxis protein CheW [Anaerobiospirillum thomasii]SPT69869.1 CheW-like domain [Anaerobiospirillum thomasii]SPT71465.1 CheW-like domain [Anaerobiospirillum thomasii]
MSLKHQIKEEETLLAYFRQMLTDPEDEDNYEQSAKEHADAEQPAVQETAAQEPVMQMQLQEEVQSAPAYQTQTITLSAPKSLQTLLESVDEHKADVIVAQDTKTQVSEPVVEVAVQTQVPTQTVADTKTDTDTAQKSETVVETVEESAVETVQEVKSDTEVAPKVETAAQVATNKAVALEQEALEAAQWEASLSVAHNTDTVQETQTQTQEAAKSKYDPDNWENIHTEEEFQTLFFTVQGVRFAVPLIDLGNIIECGKITQIFGKPAWYMGMTDCRGDKINIVDTLLWVKPEIGESPDRYPYLISLSRSNWALGCDVLEGNRTLKRSQVKWRVNAGSRPWLAGIVKDQMCALLHVEALISLFEKGMDFGKLKEKFGDIS